MIRTRLTSILNQELQSQGLQLTPYCQQQFEQLLSNGVQRLSLVRPAPKPAHTMQAERNLKGLVKFFCDFAQDRGTFPRLENADFNAALSQCPPHWPFHASN